MSGAYVGPMKISLREIASGGNAMKCLYFLASTLKTSRDVSDDLHDIGIKDFYLHVISQDESGLKREHVHSGNYLETRDVIRDGCIGAVMGLAAGLIGIGLLAYFKPLGADVQIPTFVYAILVAVATLFGAWEGGLVGIEKENKKLKRFHDDIAAGKYLILVYVRKHLESKVRDMMERKHADAALVAVDTHFVNPFASPQQVVHTSSTS
jgi:hypothetical protein